MNSLCWQNHLVLNKGYEQAEKIMTAQSLTAALRGLGAAFSVELLYLGEQIWQGQPVFVRDVLLHLDGVPVVEARSLCDIHAADWRGLLDCGTQPLGERLFNGSLPLIRSPFEFADCQQAHLFRRPQMARRSYFDWHGERLELTEYFLPELNHFL